MSARLRRGKTVTRVAEDRFASNQTAIDDLFDTPGERHAYALMLAQGRHGGERAGRSLQHAPRVRATARTTFLAHDATPSNLPSAVPDVTR